MIKIAFFCVIIVISYIHCNSINISNHNDPPIALPIKDAQQMKFLTSLNLSQIRTNQSDNKPSDMNGYYKWLNFLKSSTSTHVNSVTILSKTQ